MVESKEISNSFNKITEEKIRELFVRVDEDMKQVSREQGPSAEYLRFRHGPLMPNPNFDPSLV